jgi:phage tail tape-measure protein
MALTATTSVGTSIIGGIIGQSLIPIPVVGALIGSVIGGFLGERGGRKITKIL